MELAPFPLCHPGLFGMKADRLSRLQRAITLSLSW